MSDNKNCSEQWKLDGDCSLCRRRNYCSKPCKKNKVMKFKIVQSAIESKMNEMTGGAYGHIMSHLNK